MKMYLTAKLPDPNEKFMIDYFELTTPDGEVLDIIWDEAEYARDNGILQVAAKGIYFNEEYANGFGGILSGARITEVRWDSESSEIPEIQSLIFNDNGNEYPIDVTPPYMDYDVTIILDTIKVRARSVEEANEKAADIFDSDPATRLHNGLSILDFETKADKMSDDQEDEEE